MAVGLVTLASVIQARAGRADDLHHALSALVEASRAEPGCINYDLHQDPDDTHRFLFYENWRTEAALKRHMATPHRRLPGPLGRAACGASRDAPLDDAERHSRPISPSPDRGRAVSAGATAAAGRPAAPGNATAVLAAVCAAGLMLPLSLTGPAIAIPAIGHSLGGSPVALGWVVNAFFLVFGSLVMAAGSLADQVGRKRTFLAGVGLFAATSLAIGLAPSILVLDLLRGVQGIAGALSLTAGTAMLAQEFEGAARTRAFGLPGTAFGVGLAAGPLWAGFLVGTLGWRSIFLVNTLIGALVLLFGAPRMRETRDPNAAGIDWPGTVTFTGTLVR